MIQRALFAAILLQSLSAFAETTDGVEGLCSQVAKTSAPSLSGAKTFSLQLIAEGPALDLADTVTNRCTSALATDGRRSAPLQMADRVVRVRLRVAAPSLTSLVEVTAKGSNQSLLSQALEVPLGGALTKWLTSAGTGLETWLAGTIDGEVLAACGDDSNGDGYAEVAFVTSDAIDLMRWTAQGFDPITHVELPPSLRAQARAPGASASCRSIDGAFILAFGIHDRDRGGVLRVVAGEPLPIQPLDGVPIGLSPSGQPLMAEGVTGTGLLRWKGKALASATALFTSKGPRVFGVTQDGAIVQDDGTGKTFAVGASIAIADLDGDGTGELLLTRPVFPSASAEDRLLMSSLESPGNTRNQSQSIRGVLNSVGVVNVGRWSRVIAAQWQNGRSQIYAVGQRLPPVSR